MNALQVNGQPFRPEPKALLGQGGEACVYRWRGLAVKLYHRDDDATLAARGAKLQALGAVPLPPAALRPQAPVLDSAGRTRGFAMELLDQALPFRRLSQRRWREGQLDNAGVLAVFRALAAALDALHRVGLVVGDLNAGNLLLVGGQPRLIDVDSLHLPGHPCVVGHEHTLDPRLYGLDLAVDPRFDAESDWYAFAVLLFSALTWVHPYGGVFDPLPTLLQRAEAGHSLLRPDVRRPAHAAPPEALPPALLGWMRGVFEDGARGRPDPQLLHAHFQRCACGLELGGVACPSCHPGAAAQAALPVEASAGACRMSRVVKISGHIVAASAQGGLRYAWVEGGRLLREGGVEVCAWRPGMQVALAGALTWVLEGRRARAFRGGALERECSVDLRRGEPVFAACEGAAVTLRGDQLVELRSGLRLGAALGGQTQLFLGERLGYGFYRPGRLTVHFLFQPQRPGLFRAALPAFEGRLLDVSVCFDADHALVSALTEAQGRRRAGLWLLDARGRCLASREGDPEADPLLTAPRALRGEVVVLATPQGLAALSAQAGRLELRRRFPDAAPLLEPEADLLPGPGGSLFTLTPQEIRRISVSA